MSSYNDFFNGSKNKWLQLIRYICDKFSPLRTIWENHSLNTRITPATLQDMKKRLIVEFHTYWKDAILKIGKNNDSGGRLEILK